MRVSVKFVYLLFICLSFAPLFAEEEYPERSRSNNIPYDHVAAFDDDYLTGYLQALIDMHYYEFQVRVIVVDRVAYLFDLPCNALIAHSIFCFISDVPCICSVQKVYCSCQDFVAYLYAQDPASGERFMESTAYQALCCMPCPGYRIRGVWMPQTTLLFAPLIADPRQPQNAAALRFNDNPIGHHVGAPSFGGDFIIFRWKDVFYWHGDMDFGLEAGIFSVFDLDNPEACLVNTDFFVAAMVTYAYDCLSYRFRWWHMSSHLGDEFILSNPGYPRFNVSDEGIDLFASVQINPAIRLYGGIGYIYSRDSEFPEHPLYLEAGAEIRVFGGRSYYDRVYIQPFLAMHFRTWEEHDYDIDQTYALGVEWSQIQGVGRMFRLFFEFHDGYSKEGQFVRNRSNYSAVKVTYGF